MPIRFHGAVACALVGAFASTALFAQDLPLARPQVVTAFAGDPRLEPIPSAPIHLGDVAVFGAGRVLHMRFPPRVNGQTHSDGDKHADLYVFFDAVTGLPIAGQPPIVDAVPIGAASVVSELTARLFSAVWELHAVTVASDYDPHGAGAIASSDAIYASPFVRQIFQTNVFLNCPVVPLGSQLSAGSAPLWHVLYNGETVALAPYDIEDGGFNPQVLFKFEDQAGHTLPSDDEPHLVLSHVPGDPFYSSVWEVWTVTVPDGFPVTSIRSIQDVRSSGLPITSSAIRLNCPVVDVETAAGSGQFEAMPVEDAANLLRNDFSTGVGRFVPATFDIDVPEGKAIALQYDAAGNPIGRTLVPSSFTKSRSFKITEIEVPTGAAPVPPLGLAARFPRIASEKGNVVPILLAHPFPLTDPTALPRVSSPDTTGETIRFTQQDLDAAFANNVPPRLPEPIEQNIAGFIAGGLLDPAWAPGQKPYVERLALVGRALHEIVWAPEHGANSKDTTSCAACHSAPASGGAARGLYSLVSRGAPLGTGPILSKTNPGSMWGSGAAELLVQQKRLRREPVTFAHGSLGNRESIRAFVAGAQNTHFGIQSAEFIAGQAATTVANAPTLDLDNDGVRDESTVGEVTAHAAYLLSLPVPKEAHDTVLPALGLTRAAIDRGRTAFRRSIKNGGAGCAACHTPFHQLTETTLFLTNPATASVLDIPITHHLASQDDVDEGRALIVGQAGLRNWGDFKLHKMGALMRSAGVNGTDTIKTAELWDVGSVFPYLRDGSKGSDLRGTILAHAGVSLKNLIVTRGPQKVAGTRVSEVVKLTNRGTVPIVASVQAPLRLVLAGPMLPIDATALNANVMAPDTSAREGAAWLVTRTIQPGASVSVELVFNNPRARAVTFSLLAQDHPGYSEAAASTRAFQALPAASQADIVAFLRAQLIDNRIGEGSGGVKVEPVEPPTDPLGLPR